MLFEIIVKQIFHESLTTAVQNLHRFALSGMRLKHSGQAFSDGSNFSPLLSLFIILFIGKTTKKYMTEEMIKNDIKALKKSPTRKSLLLMAKTILEKSGWPPIAPIRGVMRSLTSAFTIAPNVLPITTATARSTTFPLSKKSRNPFNIKTLYYFFHFETSRSTL